MAIRKKSGGPAPRRDAPKKPRSRGPGKPKMPGRGAGDGPERPSDRSPSRGGSSRGPATRGPASRGPASRSPESRGPASRKPPRAPAPRGPGRSAGKVPPKPPRAKAPPKPRTSRDADARDGGPRTGGRRAPGVRPTGKRPLLRKDRPAIRVTAEAGAVETDGKIRLNRFLASAGVCSRRAADTMIKGGRVSLNGTVVRELGVRIDPQQDLVRFDGVRVEREKPVYVLFNKPKGVLCTNATNEPRKRVVDYMPSVRGRIYTIGRLDAESEGLILLTNDGDFTQHIAHPRYGVPKTYAVLVRGRVTPEDLDKARGGVWLAEGRTGGARIVVVRMSADRTYLRVSIREGKNRELRRVFARLGYNVISLKRIRIGGLSLHGLGEGKYRFLRAEEVTELLAAGRREDMPEPTMDDDGHDDGHDDGDG
jgi:23S rRNA pseudouridine2605 synthase